jgi:hypothetical protein
MPYPLANGIVIHPDDPVMVIAEGNSLGVYSTQSLKYEVILRLKSAALVRRLAALNFPHIVGTDPVLDGFLASQAFAKHMAPFFRAVPQDSDDARVAQERALRVREVLQRLDGTTGVGSAALVSVVRQAVTSARFAFIGSMWVAHEPLHLAGWDAEHLDWPPGQDEPPPGLVSHLGSRGADAVVVADLAEMGVARARSLLDLVAAQGGTVLPLRYTERSLVLGPTLFACDAWDVPALLEGLPTGVPPTLYTWGQRMALALVESELPFTVRRVVETQKRDVSLTIGSMFCLDLRSMTGEQIEVLPGVRLERTSTVIEHFEHRSARIYR